uniref:AlNc14C5G712 protein n=1 Tax=Albugo laibachii Nc14 TaxID=890382 RepID=F0W0S7_9STRA|nr:AlNc14C5G712 [Albugo laibachii Nc14]|eukprot:CCA14651.1 AlNc14C5G712 [Albugo laibachii Nc14]
MIKSYKHLSQQLPGILTVDLYHTIKANNVPKVGNNFDHPKGAIELPSGA